MEGTVGEAMLFPFCSDMTRGLVRLGVTAVGATAFAVACAPTEPTVRAEDPEPAVALVAAPSTAMAAYADTGLGELIESAPKSIVAGKRLNVELLRRFYGRHGFAPVWTTREAQASSLMDAVLRARDHGLAPELFHADVLRSPANLPMLDRELLLSDAFLTYADALARGAMPVERRRDDEALTPEPIDVAATLDAALGSSDPASVIEALAPTTPTYRLLRQALQDSRTGIPVGGKVATTRMREIAVNLERERWLPRRLPADRVWVNVADGRLVLYRDDRPIFSTRVIVGQSDRRNQSPEVQASIDGIWFNPPWNIPSDIATNEILPKMRQDPNYLVRNNMVSLPDGGLQQLAGANSGLGQLMFYMKNRFDVYLHDTPSKSLFSRYDRRISRGCIRVEDPQKLAALLMQQPIDAIDEAIAAGSTTWKVLPKPVPVFLVYETAFADADERLQFRTDIYERDPAIWQYLDSRERAVAEREAPDRRQR
ncbi:L,D-transpeptidase family protein [Reyranella sp.]|uniref:L,D-transpeptidase family protein n=1 Tax=Reyranella sp. TaxID=1929291 RepID=UPI003D0A15B1